MKKNEKHFNDKKINEKSEIKSEYIDSEDANRDEEIDTDNISEEIIDESDKLKEENESLTEQVKDLKDKMLRLQADTDNYRKRMLREKEDAVNFANEKIILELLSFIDNMDRAINAAQNGGDINSLTDGVKLIKEQLLNTLNKNWGLEKILTDNVEFNPDEHEACMAETNSDLEKEMVVSELQTGYKLHGRVIRPAKVKIAKP